MPPKPTNKDDNLLHRRHIFETQVWQVYGLVVLRFNSRASFVPSLHQNRTHCCQTSTPCIQAALLVGQ